MVHLPSKRFERDALDAGYGCVVGVDEVGMGCLAGPVVVCAAVFYPEFFRGRVRGLEWVRDSKLLQPKQREGFARALSKHPLIRHAIAVVSVRDVDKLNVYQAARVGMRRAIGKLGVENAFIFVDGPHTIAGVDVPQRAVVKGDQKIFAISAASILAKVHRDALMTRYAKRYPAYGFNQHKGYATQLHRERLAKYGLCPLHRRSFAGVVIS